MSADRLGELLKGLGVPFKENTPKKELLELLTNATPGHYLVVIPDPLQVEK